MNDSDPFNVVPFQPRDGIGEGFADCAVIRKPGRILSPPNQKPIIRIVAGTLPAVVSAAERHLVASDKEIFQRGDSIIRPAVQRIPIADDHKTSGGA